MLGCGFTCFLALRVWVLFFCVVFIVCGVSDFLLGVVVEGVEGIEGEEIEEAGIEGIEGTEGEGVEREGTDGIEGIEIEDKAGSGVAEIAGEVKLEGVEIFLLSFLDCVAGCCFFGVVSFFWGFVLFVGGIGVFCVFCGCLSFLSFFFLFCGGAVNVVLLLLFGVLGISGAVDFDLFLLSLLTLAALLFFGVLLVFGVLLLLFFGGLAFCAPLFSFFSCFTCSMC